MMTLVLAVMWLCIAIYLFYKGIKEFKILAVFSVYFLFNACWWCADYFVSADMFHGTFGWIFRGVTAVFLMIGSIFYYYYRTHGGREKDLEKENKK